MPQSLREDAFFRREDGRWYYVDGNVHGQDPYRRETPKVGRTPCPRRRQEVQEMPGK